MHACFHWARELYGYHSSLLALALWCYSPNVIARGSSITPDVGAAALRVAGCYAYWLWLKEPTWKRAFLAGLLLGMLRLTKMTWIIFFGLWPLVWLDWIRSRFLECKAESWKKQIRQLIATLLWGIYILNLGYGFEGAFKRPGDYTFISRTLAAENSVVDLGGEVSALPVPGWMHELMQVLSAVAVFLLEVVSKPKTT
ncbi:hypothetical protein Pan110_16340 [Gimesia panareensis]|nr:hypothetical protein Pan110_16340 [Gimesia panareensis]